MNQKWVRALGSVIGLSLFFGTNAYGINLQGICASWIAAQVPSLHPSELASPVAGGDEFPVPFELALHGYSAEIASLFALTPHFESLYSSFDEGEREARIANSINPAFEARVLSIGKTNGALAAYLRSTGRDVNELALQLPRGLMMPDHAPPQYRDWVALGPTNWANRFQSQTFGSTMIQGSLAALDARDRDRLLDQVFESLRMDGMMTYLIPLEVDPRESHPERIRDQEYQRAAAARVRTFVEAKLKELKEFTDKQYYDLDLSVGHIDVKIPNADRELAKTLLQSEYQATGISPSDLVRQYQALAKKSTIYLRVSIARRIPSQWEYWYSGRQK